MRLFTILNQKTQTLGRLVFNFQLKRAGKNKWEATSQQFTQIFYRRSENTGIILSATNQHLAPPPVIISWGFSTTATYPRTAVHLFIHILESFSQEEPDVFSLFPMKAAGLYRAGSKGLDGEANPPLSAC